MPFLILSRTITAADPDASAVPPTPCNPMCTSLTIGAISDKGGAQIQLSINWIDSADNYIGSFGPITLVAEKVASWAGGFRAFPSDGGEATYHVGGYAALIQVIALSNPSTAKWTLTAGAQ